MTRSIPLLIGPDPDDPGCADVMVDGMVDGLPSRFVLDTGAARTQVIGDRTADAAAAQSEVSHGVFGKYDDAHVRRSNVVIDGLGVFDVEATLVDADQPGARNLLAMDVLTNFCCHFRFDSATLVIDEPHPADRMEMLLMDEASHPYVEATWPGVAANCVWDSGAGLTIVDQAFWSTHRDLFTDPGMSTGTDATGSKAETPTYTIAGARIGGHQFAPHKTAVVDLSEANATLTYRMDMILGYPTLRQANWLFDFPRRAWSITSTSDVAP